MMLLVIQKSLGCYFSLPCVTADVQTSVQIFSLCRLHLSRASLFRTQCRLTSCTSLSQKDSNYGLFNNSSDISMTKLTSHRLIGTFH